MVAIGSQIGGSTVSLLIGNITLKVNPDTPLGGRDISFTLRLTSKMIHLLKDQD